MPTAARLPILSRMFIVTEADAAAIRVAFEQGGELAAAIEVRRLFPGITDNVRRGSAHAPLLAGTRPLHHHVQFRSYARVESDSPLTNCTTRDNR